MSDSVLIVAMICGTFIVCAGLLFYFIAAPSWWERNKIKAEIKDLQIRTKRMEDKHLANLLSGKK